MKAVILQQAGNAAQLQVQEIDRPSISAQHVLLKTASAGINPIEIKTRNGNRFTEPLLADKPSILGWELSGTVVEKGDAVSDFEIGDQVYGMLNFPDFGKAYAEYAAANPKDLVKIPSNLSLTDAGAVPLAGLTAFQALRDEGKLTQGTKVLIHAAGGGVGHFGVQIAKAMGAKVWVTASAAKKEFVQNLGADEVIDYQQERFENVAQNMDVVFDLIGGDYIDRSLQCLKKGGVIICIPTATNAGVEENAAAKGCKGVAFKVKPNQNDLQTLTQLITAQKVTPHLSAKYPVDEVREAHEHIENGGTKGKIVITF